MTVGRVRILVAVLPGDPDAVLVRSLRDAGHEVVQIGAHGAEELAATAIQEDVDLVVVRRSSSPAGPADDDVRLRAALAAADAADVDVLGLDADDPPRVVLEHLVAR